MLKKLEQGALALAGLCIVALGLVITATVTLRNFGSGVTDDVVIVSELMVGAIFLPLSYVTANYGHICIEFLFKRMKPPIQLWLLAIGSMISLLILCPLAFAAWIDFSHAVDAGAYFFGELELPEWPGRFAFLLGAVLFVLRLSVICVADIHAALSGNVGYLVQRDAAENDIVEEG
ncbi:MAG: TRAP transporter small permease [Candidatus Thiodiazotropha sp.]